MDYYSAEQRREYTNNYRNARRDYAFSILGDRCGKCGSLDELHFDHVDPSTKIMEIGKMWTSSRKKFEEELTKCQVLCKECHIKKSIQEGSFKGPSVQPVEHGKVYTYAKYGCRCNLCREAKKLARLR